MNLSKTHDPFRFLKRKKNVTPQKLKDNSLEEHYRIISDHLTSLAQSKISNIEETNSKRNHYDPNKYYSAKCQNYLKIIKFNQRQADKQSRGHHNILAINVKTDESTDSLPILRTKEKEGSNIISLKQNQPQQMTFKKLDFQGQTGKKIEQKNNIQPQPFNQPNYEMMDVDPANMQRKECPVCGRQFNLSSFEKHTRICENVFAKKRKPFSSEKQRSQSKQKK